MTIRGCAYAGSKGVVWGPVKDMVHISHGPVGCGQYSWSQRRNYYIGNTGIDTFVTMQFTSDFQERDIVFGGDKKLDKVIDEINELFPLANGVTIQSECPIGLIGDDIEAVAKKKAKEIGKTIVPVRCEGFRGVSQSLGHHIANDAIRDWVFDKKEIELGSRSLRRQRHRRLQHRRRRLGLAHPARGNGPARRRQLVGRRDAGRNRARAEGQAQSHPLLPLDELHLPAHGGEVRRRLDGVQFLRAVADRGLAAQDRQALRPGDRGQGGGGDRQISAAGRRRDRQVQAAPRRQDGDALCRRPAPAPRHHRL